MLEQQLAAPAARHERVAVAVDARKATSLPPPVMCEGGDQPALGAEGHAVGGVLDVAPETIRPSSTSAAAPTGKFEYGEYA